MNDDLVLRDINYNLILLMSDLTRTVIMVYVAFHRIYKPRKKSKLNWIIKQLIFLSVKLLIEK